MTEGIYHSIREFVNPRFSGSLDLFAAAVLGGGAMRMHEPDWLPTAAVGSMRHVRRGEACLPSLDGGSASCMAPLGAAYLRQSDEWWWILRLPGILEMDVPGGSNRLLTPAEVAGWLKVSEVTVKNKYRTWGIKAQKVGRLLRFRERDIVAYLDSRYG
ncbi:helix-turn-helix domain-containing protein [Streptomyces sp. NBC_01233]|uniref:helix-turn-helix domain-containing protein n=2 Tax=Streptomyces TaxID=1883 RepID=UPI002E166926|nr:helix-turn-helix domain-containing protein [Streptomyces sp. NBC_01233]